jgi:arylsulfatase A-like enzyme
MLTGQYGHNTGIFINDGLGGGFQRAYELSVEKSTVATWLRSAGYKTVLIGKYLNGYPSAASGWNYVPPGWSEWYGNQGGLQFNYTLVENGKIVHYGTAAKDYMQDVLRRKAVDFIRRNAASADRAPFFMWLATSSPHGPAQFAPRHAGAFPGAKAPRTPTFNEADVSRRPAWLQTHPLLTPSEIAQIDDLYRNRLRSMLAVVERVDAIIATLQQTGDLANTYIIFTSDNGFHLVQHRLPAGKGNIFEEGLRVPFIVRGPGIPAGRALAHMTVNIDLAPTFADIAGVSPTIPVDGRSLVPLLKASPPPVSAWRRAFLLEHGFAGRHPASGAIGAGDQPSTEFPDLDETLVRATTGPSPNVPAIVKRAPTFDGIRTGRYSYADLVDGTLNVYDLQQDPFEHVNIATSAPPAVLNQLGRWLDALRNCAGPSCRTAEDGPPQ